MAFHNLIRLAGNSYSFEHELDSLPITNGIRISRRLAKPTMMNCNQLVSLEQLEQAANIQKPQPVKKLSPSTVTLQA